MKIFIAGPRKIYKLDRAILERIDNIIERGYTIMVGDASGVDKAVQSYCYEKKYTDIIVYATNGYARNNIGKWKVENVKVSSNIKGFDFYSAKDYEMAKDCDYGFMIWNKKSKGTLNNMINLTSLNKKIVLFLNDEKKFYNFSKVSSVKSLVEICSEEVKDIFDKLYEKKYVKQMVFDNMMISESKSEYEVNETRKM